MEENEVEYKFNGDFTLDDYVQMNKHIMKTKFSKIGWRISFITLGILIVGLIIFNAFFGNTWEIIKSLAEIVWIPVFILIYFRFLLSKWRLRKYYESNKIYNEKKSFEIDETNILIKSESTNINLKKETIVKIEFDKDSIYIFTSLLTIIIIKQRFLENIDNFNELKNLIIKYYK
jgi:hypothetical protein